MFGIRFIKSQPTVHLMQFRAGQVVREGIGHSFFYYAPTTTLVAVPIASKDRPFILELVTADFQSVTVQGQVTYRIGDPRRTASGRYPTPAAWPVGRSRVSWLGLASHVRRVVSGGVPDRAERVPRAGCRSDPREVLTANGL